MTIQNGANLYTQGFGSRPENVEIPFVAQRAPLPTDTNFPVGKRWIDQASNPNTVYELTSFTSSQGQVLATWLLFLTGAPGGMGIEFLDGNTGSATGTTVTLDATTNSGSTVAFAASGATVTLGVTDGSGNTAIGLSAGKAGESGSNNTFLGSAAGNSITTGSSNTGVGKSALAALTTGSSNVGVGLQAGASIITGSSNLIIGSQAGSAYTGAESSNIVIGVAGTNGESNTIRIGNPGSGAGQQNRFIVAAVAGISVSNAQAVTINTSTGQLGSIPLGSTLIQRQTASNSTALNFTTGISSTYTNYMIIFDNLIPVVAGTFDMQLSIDGGATYLNTGYAGGENSNLYNNVIFTNVNSTNFFPITPSVDTTAAGGASGVIFLYGLTSTNLKMISGSGTSLSGGGAIVFSNVFGSQSTLSAVNALTIFGDAGNIASGTVSLYGFN